MSRSRWPQWADRLAWLVAGAATVVITVGLISAPATPADRVESIASRLRCPVCQSVSVAESPAQEARDMRDLIAQQVTEGRSDEEIIAFFVGRYGEWIILAPPARGGTLFLWLLPPAALGAGFVVAAGRRRRIRLRPKRKAFPL